MTAYCAPSPPHPPEAPLNDAPLLEVDDLRCAVAAIPRLTLEAGGCAAVSGASGSGKTRLLRALADLDPNEGEVRLRGRSRSAFPPPAWRRHVAYLPADSGWWAETVGQHFPEPGDSADAGSRTPPTASLLEAVGFGDEVLAWSVERLSTGERSRLALVRALARGPDVLLLDEPTANLDAATAGAVERLVEDYRREGAGVIWVTHDEAQKERLRASRWTVHEGRLVPAAEDP